MFAKVSKLSAPIAAAIFLVSAGLATTATAAPQPGKLQVQTPQAELVIKADHRRGHGRHGWDGGHRGRHQFMGPRQIHRSLRHRGFRDINILDRRGPMYVVKARGWRGVPMRLVVDSRNARIVRSQPMWHHGRGHHRWH